MRLPWQKRKPSPAKQRRLTEIERMEYVVGKLHQVLELRPEERHHLIEENAILRRSFADALEGQKKLADRLYRLERRVCRRCLRKAAREGWLKASPPAPPSKSDPDYDAAMRHAAEEDARK